MLNLYFIVETYGIYLITGMISGFIAGLLGIGGGLIVVPSLIFIFAWKGFDSSISTHLAIGTSMACMVGTSYSSLIVHMKKKMINVSVLFWLSIGLLPGSCLGSIFTVLINAKNLKMLFGIMVFIIACLMWKKNNYAQSDPPQKLFFLTFIGFIFGCISSLFGIGGSFLTIPLLYRIGIKMHTTIGTSSACCFLIAVIGTIVQIFHGYNKVTLPEYASGFVYFPALIGILLGSIPCARIGANLTHKLSQKKLRKTFSLILFITSIELLVKE